MYCSYTGTLPAFIGAPQGQRLCSSSAGVCMGPGGAMVPSRLLPLPHQSLPVLLGCPSSSRRYLTFKYFPGGALVVSGRPWFIPIVPGGAPVHPDRSRIMHQGSTGIRETGL
ncbi:hypothetical protein DPMN_058314 [Dreissena polymorpha]|uniref:Uncharacterized protein n=1 Tax=Dreissena polymorpha TaxID=45954 RepID=A0A9D4C1I7_DREPO|nr:hypothetical protein DPMN_058314 [Dreissena polymorpha]